MKLIFAFFFPLSLSTSKIITKKNFAGNTNYYVDNTFVGTSNGSISAPYTTIAQANSKLYVMNPGDSMLFRRGQTFYGKVNIDNQGTAANRIVVGAYGAGEKPVIHAGVKVNFSGTRVSVGNDGKIIEGVQTGNIYVSDVLSSVSVPTLIMRNSIALRLTREPDIEDNSRKGYMNIDATSTPATGKRTLTSDEMINSSTKNYSNNVGTGTAQVIIRTGKDNISVYDIETHSGTSITFSGSSGNTGWGYIVQNDPRMMDRDGEYFWNETTHKCYIYSTQGTPTNIEICKETNGITTGSGGRQYLDIVGLEVRASKGNAINLVDCSYSRIIDCDVIGSGDAGIRHSSHYGEVIGCTTDWTLGSGIAFTQNRDHTKCINNTV